MGELSWSFSSCKWKDPFVKFHVVCTRSCELESKNESDFYHGGDAMQIAV